MLISYVREGEQIEISPMIINTAAFALHAVY
jgi:hypothetical protein